MSIRGLAAVVAGVTLMVSSPIATSAATSHRVAAAPASTALACNGATTSVAGLTLRCSGSGASAVTLALAAPACAGLGCVVSVVAAAASTTAAALSTSVSRASGSSASATVAVGSGSGSTAPSVTLSAADPGGGITAIDARQTTTGAAVVSITFNPARGQGATPLTCGSGAVKGQDLSLACQGSASSLVVGAVAPAVCTGRQCTQAVDLALAPGAAGGIAAAPINVYIDIDTRGGKIVISFHIDWGGQDTVALLSATPNGAGVTVTGATNALVSATEAVAIFSYTRK